MRMSFILLVLSATAATTGARTGLAPDPLQYTTPSRNFDTIHTGLDLDLDLEHQKISGSVTHTMRALRPGLAGIRLNCVGLSVSAVTVNGAPARFDYPVAGELASSWFGTQEETHADDQLVVHVDPALGRGAEFTVRVEYSGEPKKGLYWMVPEKGIPAQRYEVWSQGEGEDNRYWIPCHDYPDDKATFDGRFRVRKGFYVLSNGELSERRDIEAKTEYHWKLATPQSAYLIMIAAGNYRVVETSADGVPVMYVVPPGTDDETIQRGYGLTPDMMRFFSRTIGIPYPFEKYAQVAVQNFIYGGMENTSATTMNMRTLYDASAGLTRNEQGLVAHELAHQWWGDMVTSREWNHLWLNEGFATYYQGLYREHHEGADAFRYEMSDRQRKVVANDTKDTRPMVTDFFNRRDARNNANIYVKGASVLHMLRFILGDELYHEVIRRYGEKHKYGCADTGALAAAVREMTGENLDWFFEQWIDLAGHPSFRISKNWNAETGVLRLDIEQTQKVEDLIPLFRTPVDLEISAGGEKTVHRVMVESQTQSYYFALPAAPDMVVFDPDEWILKEVEFPQTAAELVYQLTNGTYMTRVRAARSLATHGTDVHTVGALAAALAADGHFGLRRECALSLSAIRDEQARKALYDGLAIKDALVRLACVEALASWKRDEDVASRLLKVMRDDAATGVRARAVTSIASIDATGAAQACMEAVQMESDRGSIRNAALAGLVTLEHTAAMPAIARYCSAGNPREYRHDAIGAYAKLAAKLDEKRDREKAARLVEGYLDDWFLRTRQAAIDALGTIDEPTSVGPLRRVASVDPLEEVRLRARRTADQIEADAGKKTAERKRDVRLRDMERRVDSLEDTLDKFKRTGPPEVKHPQ